MEVPRDHLKTHQNMTKNNYIKNMTLFIDMANIQY